MEEAVATLGRGIVEVGWGDAIVDTAAAGIRGSCQCSEVARGHRCWGWQAVATVNTRVRGWLDTNTGGG